MNRGLSSTRAQTEAGDITEPDSVPVGMPNILSYPFSTLQSQSDLLFLSHRVRCIVSKTISISSASITISSVCQDAINLDHHLTICRSPLSILHGRLPSEILCRCVAANIRTATNLRWTSSESCVTTNNVHVSSSLLSPCTSRIFPCLQP